MIFKIDAGFYLVNTLMSPAHPAPIRQQKQYSSFYAFIVLIYPSTFID